MKIKKYKDITIRKFEQPPFGTNTYLMTIENEQEAILFDPSGNPDEVINKAKKENLNIKKIYLTHGHLDHWIGSKKIQDFFECDIYLHEKDFGSYVVTSGGDLLKYVNKKKVKIIRLPVHSKNPLLILINTIILSLVIIFLNINIFFKSTNTRFEGIYSWI